VPKTILAPQGPVEIR